MAGLIATLLDQNSVLRRTRDRLLPRLLSGQLKLAELKGEEAAHAGSIVAGTTVSLA